MKYPTRTYAPGANGLIKVCDNCRTCCYSLMGPLVTVEAQLVVVHDNCNMLDDLVHRGECKHDRVLAPLFSCFIFVCIEYRVSDCKISLCETEWTRVLWIVFYILYAHKDNPYIFSYFKQGGTFSNQASEICWLAWRILCQKAGAYSLTLLAWLMCARMLWRA